jgi:hypothetical protein
MTDRQSKLVVLGKLLLAAVALVALVAIPGRELTPAMPIGDLLLYCAAGVVGLFVLLVALTVCSLQFAQFILRMGGTDTQWFWFSSEPRGLVAMREGKTIKGVERDES